MLTVSYKGKGFFLVIYGLAKKDHGLRLGNVTVARFTSIKVF